MQAHGGWRDLGVMMSSSYHMDILHGKKEHLSKKVVTTTYTLEKEFFEVAAFEG